MHNIMILFFSKYVNSDILSDLILGKRRRKGRKRPDASILSFDLTIAVYCNDKLNEFVMLF